MCESSFKERISYIILCTELVLHIFNYSQLKWIVNRLNIEGLIIRDRRLSPSSVKADDLNRIIKNSEVIII